VGNFIENIYNQSPVFLQNFFCTMYGFKEKRKRYGDYFKRKLDELEKSQWLSAEEIEEYQNKQLQKIINHAYYTVPYYRECLDNLKIKPSDIRSKADLSKLPILTKDQVRKNLDKLISSNYPKNRMIKMKTSGTSGKSLELYHTLEQIQFQWAVWWRHRRRFGINIDDKHATFTGKTVVPINQKKPPFWRENFATNQTLFNMQHIKRENVKFIVDKINEANFKYFSGYPSIIYSLCKFIEEEGLSLTNYPQYVFTGAEKLYDFQKETIERVLNCTVTDQYGFTEGCGNASKCEYGVYHEDFEFGILEVVDGEIIATGFADYGMPLIRYKTGDSAILANTKCKCGRHSTVLLDIEGRVEDTILTPEGAEIKRFDYLFKDTKNIIEAQVYQEELNRVVIRIVKGEGYSEKEETYLREKFKKMYSKTMVVDFEYFDEIPREKSGKFKAVKSKLTKV
jgi:phenylacetate-CoA ligase